MRRKPGLPARGWGAISWSRAAYRPSGESGGLWVAHVWPTTRTDEASTTATLAPRRRHGLEGEENVMWRGELREEALEQEPV